MPDMVLLETEEQMEQSMEILKHELVKIRTGRANPKMLEDVQVEYYGAKTPLHQIGKISVPEATQLLIKPYDKSIVGDVEKAILAANLGVNPSNEGEQIRIVLPAPTKERRQQLTKDVKRLGEEAKVRIRNARRHGNDGIKKLEKAGDISEDASKGYQEDIQELTDQYTDQVDEMVEQKDKEIMSI